MTLPEIDPRSGRPLHTDFRRRGPWGAHFARSGNIPNTPAQGSAEDLTRRWAVGPANYHYYLSFNINSYYYYDDDDYYDDNYD